MGAPVGIVPACGAIAIIDGGIGIGIGNGCCCGAIDACAACCGANIGAPPCGMGAIDAAIGTGIEAGMGSGDEELRKVAAFGSNGGRSIGSAIGSVMGLPGPGAIDGADGADGARGAMDGADGATEARGAIDGAEGARAATAVADTTVRAATDGGDGGAIDGARGAIGGWLARGGIDADFAVGFGASADASLIRRVPGATLTGGRLSSTPLTGLPSRRFVSSASASAMSGGRPCAVAASS